MYKIQQNNFLKMEKIKYEAKIQRKQDTSKCRTINLRIVFIDQ